MSFIQSNLEKNIISFSGFTIKTQVKNGIEKKIISNMPVWKDINRDNCINYKGNNCAIICGRLSNITVIDFDTIESYNSCIIDFPILSQFKTIQTKNGFHIYGLYTELFKTSTNCMIYPNVDVRNDKSIVFAPPTKYSLSNNTIIEYIDKGGDILEFPTDFINCQKHLNKQLIINKNIALKTADKEQRIITKNAEKEQKIITKNANKEQQIAEKEQRLIIKNAEKEQRIITKNAEKEQQNADKIDRQLRKKAEKKLNSNIYEGLNEIINKGLLDHMFEYTEWRNVAFALHTMGWWDLFNNFSKRDPKYDWNSCDKLWKSIKDSLENNITILSIYFWAKENDVDLFASCKIDENAITEIILDDYFTRKSKIFEETHCKIINNGVYVCEVNNEILLFTQTEMYNKWCHIEFTKSVPFIYKWVSNNNAIRSKYNMGVFLKNCPDDTYNLWNPFKMELVKSYIKNPKAIELFIKHISILTNHEEIVRDYVINWTAYCIQFPELKNKMLNFVSKQGAGKNTYLEYLKQFFGSKKVLDCSTPARDVWGQFNGQMADAFIVNLSELSPIDLKSADGFLKALITDPTITINQKNMKPIQIASYHKFISCTNHMETNKPSGDDRRNVVILCGDDLVKFNKSTEELTIIDDYLKEIYASINNIDDMKTVYEWLKTLKVDDFATVSIPKTEYHMNQIQLSQTPIQLWFADFILSIAGTETKQFTAKELYTNFLDWLKQNNTTHQCTSIQFFVRLKNHSFKGYTQKHTKNGNEYIFL